MNKKILGSVLLSFGVLLVIALALPLSAEAQSIQSLIDNFAKSLSGVGISLAVIGFVVAGIMFITSTANPSNMSVAKGALVAAVIGVVILILSGGAYDFVKGMFF